MSFLTFIAIFQLLTFMLLTGFIICWYRRIENAVSVLKQLEGIRQELIKERLSIDTYQKENSDLTFRLLTVSRKLRHCYRDCGEYQNDINGLRTKLKLPLIEFQPASSSLDEEHRS